MAPKNIQEEEKGITDLVPPSETNRPTTIIEVGDRRWRVLQHAVEAIPYDYVSALTASTMRDSYPPWRCCRCGREVEDRHSLWSPPTTVICRACRHWSGDEKARPYCPYCATRMAPILPLNPPSEGLVYLFVCPLHHTYLLSDSLEGI